jgi:hypothetical protein
MIRSIRTAVVTKFRFLEFMDVNVSSDEPEVAFLGIERELRKLYERDAEDSENAYGLLRAKHAFFSDVHAAATYYGISPLSQHRRPDKEERGSHEFYDEFIDEVDYCVAGLLLRAADRNRSLTSQLDDSARRSISRLLNRVKEQVAGLDIPEAKKVLINRRIEALEAELQGRFTRWSVFGALLIEVCTDVGAATEALEPVWRTIERIGAALGWAKRIENSQQQLPKSREPKQIEGPKTGKRKLIADDEIPF